MDNFGIVELPNILKSYALYKQFWKECLDFCEVTYDINDTIAHEICTSDLIHEKPHWFTSYELNYAENVFKNLKGQEHKVAVFSRECWKSMYPKLLTSCGE